MVRSEMLTIWWIRRDLRLEDNQALQWALDQGLDILPVFILDDHLLDKAGEKRKAFLYAGLHELAASLRERGSNLIIRRGNPTAQLIRLSMETHARSVVAEADISPYARQRDALVAQELDLNLVHGQGIFPPGLVLRPDGKPYTVFTPFSRAWKALPMNIQYFTAPGRFTATTQAISEPLPEITSSLKFNAGEQHAKRRLEAFINGPVFDYADHRDRLDLDGTSNLSPFLRFGMISPRRIAAAVKQAGEQAVTVAARTSVDKWLNEIIWREFYQSILFHFPHVHRSAFRNEMENIPWRSTRDEFDAWKHGMTGYPIVDAGMRQLAATGWMHNRARMITASFLVKHLLINWREGERWFMQELVDGDSASNNGGWQWIAGTGTDAAPYFRIFNPVLQAKKHDPLGDYVRTWVPELKNVPQTYIYSPWEMPVEVQRKFGLMIGKAYPQPIVDHDFARKRALQAYSTCRPIKQG